MKNPIYIVLLFLLIAVSAFMIINLRVTSSTQNPTQNTAIITQKTTGTILPAGFPSIPVYPGAKEIPPIEDEDEKPGGIAFKYEAAWETDDLIPAVSQWYVNNQNQDWHITTPPFDPGARGQQIILADYKSWQVYITLRKIDKDKPTLIMVGVKPV